MNMTRGFSALFAAAIFGLPATASAHRLPSSSLTHRRASATEAGVQAWLLRPGVGVVVGAAVVVRVGAAVAVAVVVLG